MLGSYVTDAQLLQEFPEGDLQELGRRAAKAARQARQATRNALYPTLADGTPTRSATLAVFQEAVLEQLRYWQTSGTDPFGSVPDEPLVASRSLDNRSVSYDNSPLLAAASLAQGSRSSLVPDALAILQDAGLISAAVTYVG